MRDFSFGLDFGTSKTAITLTRTNINAPITDVAIDNTLRKRIPTCVLYKTDTNQLWIGQPAEQEIRLEVRPSARRLLRFSANFKPHIHQSKDAREIAGQFLTAIAQAEGLGPKIRLHFEDAILAAGYPVSWADEGARTLIRLLKEAGFPPAFVVPEPAGAALYFLATGELRAQDLHRDMLVFDWGAGTFDMTLLRAGQLKVQSDNSWGSTLYGGRLFDDLFYQWLIEIARQNGRQQDLDFLMSRPIDQEFLHGFICREIKESFSVAYATAHANNQPDQDWTYEHAVTIGVGGNRIDLGDFLVSRLSNLNDRMRSYRASERARDWLQRAQTEVQPVEREFVNALLDGKATDLQAWGQTLVTEGLRQLRVGSNAIAVLTGGSCNWKWFKDIVRASGPFVGEGSQVHVDDEPELTIARGLARAYAVGRHSRRLIQQISSMREQFLPALCEIHRTPLEDLSYRISAEMRQDEKLQNSVQQIFAESFRAGLTNPKPVRKARGFWEMLLAFFRGSYERVIKEDPNEQVLRPKLERLIGDWILANEATLQRRWGEKFAATAHRSIMDLLRKDLDLEGLVEVAVEACRALGPMSFDQALKTVGGNVRFRPDMVSRIYSELFRLITIVSSRSSAVSQTTEKEVQKEAHDATHRFFQDMPEAISRNIRQVQSDEQWARYVIDDLIGTLQTLAEFANAEAASQLDGSLSSAA
jgi:hypothetical protein